MADCSVAVTGPDTAINVQASCTGVDASAYLVNMETDGAAPSTTLNYVTLYVSGFTPASWSTASDSTACGNATVGTWGETGTTVTANFTYNGVVCRGMYGALFGQLPSEWTLAHPVFASTEDEATWITWGGPLSVSIVQGQLAAGTGTAMVGVVAGAGQSLGPGVVAVAGSSVVVVVCMAVVTLVLRFIRRSGSL